MGDKTPWSDIAPMKIKQKLPEFEIGTYKSIFNMSLSSLEDDNEEDMEDKNESPEEEEDLKRIQSDMETEIQQEERRKKLQYLIRGRQKEILIH